MGLPRFGTAEDTPAILGQNNTQQAVLVLGPKVADYQTLFEAPGRERPVPLFPVGFDVPMNLYQTIHRYCVKALQADADLTFARFVVSQSSADKEKQAHPDSVEK